MRFEELKIGDKFVFTFITENEEQNNFRPLFMKTETVKDKYYSYSYNAIELAGKHKGEFSEIGKYEPVIPIK